MNSQNEISIEKVTIGLGFLGRRLSEREKQHVLIPFLKGFVEDEDLMDECFEYNFTNLMAVFCLLSRSSNMKKVAALFQFYDADKSNTLEKDELEKMLKNLIRIIGYYSMNLMRHNQFVKRVLYNKNKVFLDLISDETKVQKDRIVSTFKIAFKINTVYILTLLFSG